MRLFTTHHCEVVDLININDPSEDEVFVLIRIV